MNLGPKLAAPSHHLLDAIGRCQQPQSQCSDIVVAGLSLEQLFQGVEGGAPVRELVDSFDFDSIQLVCKSQFLEIIDQ